MPIADYDSELFTEIVVVNDKVSFKVRPITLSDASTIIEIHQPAVEAIYTKVEAYRMTVSTWNEAVVTDIAMEMLKSSPMLIATIICQAADEWDQADKVMKMPFTVQFDALRKIGALTFHDLAGAKNFLTDVWSLIRAIIPETNQASVIEQREAE